MRSASLKGKRKYAVYSSQRCTFSKQNEMHVNYPPNHIPEALQISTHRVEESFWLNCLRISAANVCCLEIFPSQIWASVSDLWWLYIYKLIPVDKCHSVRLLILLPSSPLLSSNEVPWLKKPNSCWWHQLILSARTFQLMGRGTPGESFFFSVPPAPQGFLWIG